MKCEQGKAFEREVRALAEAQGWSDDTLGELAFGWLINAAEPGTQEVFAEWLRNVADTENDPGDDMEAEQRVRY